MILSCRKRKMSVRNIEFITNKHKCTYGIISVSSNLSYLIYIYYSDKLYDVGKFWSSNLIVSYVMFEVLKQIALKRLYKNDFTHFCRDQVKSKKNPANAKSKIKESIKFGGMLLASTFIYAFICIILGAPALSQYEETLTLASLLTILTVLPFTCFLGTNSTVSLLFSDKFESSSPNILNNLFVEILKYNTVGVILGSWGASIAAPLDWDREWQEYPIPNILGALGGYLLGNVSAILVIILGITRKKFDKKNLF